MEIKGKRFLKLFQYFMLLILFAAALFLPAYGAKREAEKTAGSEASEALESELAEDVAPGTDNKTAKDEMSGSWAAEDYASESGTAEYETPENGTAEDTDSGSGTAENGTAGKIVIDPGHGGMDSGMVGESGASEKVLNLIYAKKLAALLEAEGYEVVLTRETEDGLYDADASNKKAQDMERRVAIIAEEDPLLTVSIHQNSYPEDSSVKGPQVFYFGQSAEGERLAAAIQDNLNEELSIERPRTQKGNMTYYILKRSVSTTVIVECGFLTNPEEEALLQEEAYQNQVAQAICDGILEYIKNGM